MSLDLFEIEQIEKAVKRLNLSENTAHWICVMFSSPTSYRQWIKRDRIKAGSQ